jgi:hypothetical protein
MMSWIDVAIPMVAGLWLVADPRALGPTEKDRARCRLAGTLLLTAAIIYLIIKLIG